MKEGLKGAAEETGKEGAKSLFHYIKEAFRKRTLSVTKVEPLSESNKEGPRPKAPTRAKASHAKKKSKGSSSKQTRRTR